MIVDWTKEGGISGFDIECDECGESTYFDEDDFMEFIAEAKSDGWKMFKDDAGEWTHLCPECAEKELKK